MLRTLFAIVLASGLACAAAPAAELTHAVPVGVSVAGVHVGGLSAEPARARIDAAFQRPIQLFDRDRILTIAPARLGLEADVESAVGSALAATPGSRIALPVRFPQRRLETLVAAIARHDDRVPVDATVIGADGAGPEFAPARSGIAVDVAALRTGLDRLLRTAGRAPLHVPARTLPAARTAATFGPVIVVNREANTLRLYEGRRLVRTFPVATGQAIYPTPAGLWRIVVKQRDPWWYPPTYDAWAKGLKPVPPGPSNPLGTRWMGLSAPGVGIHGTDAPASIGYSASHGCIRMQVPDAEWLFEHVRVGTPVVIV